ncbi:MULTISPECIES: acetyl-CoA hydrolase/transferase family protein [Allobacillus]|uniref:Acetyl-CoA hydrolase/transferase family protein n=1 Tax=Allobacillus halotolerans TaxID=570278 RepID=A0ABS6GLY3_9BACI|nr:MULTISPECIES: acetyl-CoA hydrolase/transferase C-terminal domain-containing protein [Allobacillus]MBU6079901.1 acetyl-CoA hydrolase/transferase family protein [Allobacillus halotolerans]TSJ62418.1 acetyl-CoA hydrolase/transferase family protein [Allobacillus sp. SKP2-8]
MNYQALYNEKLQSVAEAVQHIQPGTDIISPLGCAEPDALIKQLENHDGLSDNRLFTMLTTRELIDVDPDKLKITSLFLGASERKAFNEGKIDLLPNHFSDLPKLLKQIARKPVVMTVVSPMDENGYFSMGTNADHTISMVKEAETILVEVNEHMPRTYGENQIHISDVTAIVEHHQPLPELPSTPGQSEKDMKIGDHVASLIKNGDTLQVGFGSIPNAIIDNLKGYRNLTIHTEMIPEKIIELFKSGAVTNENNPFKKGKMTATFAYGSKKLYDFMHENDDIYMLPVSQTNNACKLKEIDDLVTVNAGVEVDFLGQVNAEKVGNTYFSSTGGQSDFQLASHFSENGRGVICLHSTAKNDEITKIVPTLQQGAPVTTHKNDVDYIVTEYGIARLRGKTIRERTKALIEIAHPKFREQLTKEAKHMGYL